MRNFTKSLFNLNTPVLIRRALFIAVFLFTAFCAVAEPNYVYHEATTSTIGCGGFQYRSVLTPNSSQPMTIGFKLEFASYWNQARIYYTTDGSAPSGAFGTGNGTTQVVNATYQCGFGSPGVSEVVNGVIPAQPAGTIVRYIVSAWHSAGGNEIFANGPGAPCGACGTITNSSSLATIFTYTVTAGPLRVASTGGTGAPSTYYASLAAAITAINGGTAHTGTITCFVDAGFTETAPVGGYLISATGTAPNPIVFQKSGTGTNPIITAFSPQAAGSFSDAVFKIMGGDYITIQDFTIQENAGNTVMATTGATNTMTEFGIALFYATTTNGAQNNTIQNNSISLNSIYGNSVAIFSTSASTAAAITTGADATNTAGSNSNNKIYSNIISNVAQGIYFICPPITGALFETGNDVGGSSAATGNTITFGSVTPVGGVWARSSTATSGAVVFRNGVGNPIRYNNITSNTLAYPMSSFGGIQMSNGTAPTVVTYTATVSNNTVTLNNTGTNGTIGIDFGYGLATGTIVSSNNTIVINQNGTAANSAAITGIRAGFISATNTISSNSITVNQSTSAGAITSAVTLINAAGAGTTVNITNNTTLVINQSVSGSGSYAAGAITYINVSAASGTVNVTGNALSTGVGSTIRSTGTFIGINQDANVTNLVNVKNNSSVIDRNAASGSVYFMYTSSGPTEVADSVSNNTITLTNISGTSAVTAISVLGGLTSPAANNKSVCNNTINISGTTTGITTGISTGYAGTGSNIAKNNVINISTAGSAVYGFSPGAGARGNISENYISLTAAGTSPTVVAINVTTGTGPFIINGNTVNNISATAAAASAPTLVGIRTSLGTLNVINNNIVRNISAATSTGVANVSGIEITGGTTPAIFSNNIYNLSADVSGISSLVSGINFQGTTSTGPFDVYNNFISDLRMPNAPATSGTGGIFAINGARTGQVYRIYYNTIKLGTAGTPVSGQAFVRIVGAGFLSVAANQVDLRNNIININASPNTTSGFASCVSLTGVTPVAGTVSNIFATTSNNNIYSVNSGVNNFLYSEGANLSALRNGYALSGLTASTPNNIVNDPSFNTSCGLYKIFMVSPRENATFTEDNLTAGSTTGTFAPAGSSYAENGAQSISAPSITTDFAGTNRTPTNDIGALQFAGSATDAVAPVITYAQNPSGSLICAPSVIATIIDATSGVNNTIGLKPRLYFKKSSEANAFGTYPGSNTAAFNGWKYVETSSTGSPYTFNFNFSLLNSPLAGGDVITYFLTAQDLASTPNVGTNTATFTGGCPATVNFANTLSATAVNNFTYTPPPSVLNLSAGATGFCVSGNTTISIISTPVLSNVTYQWEESTASAGPFANAGGASTNATYTTATITGTMYYRVRVFCNGVELSASPSAPIAINVTTPTVVTTTPGSRCGPGTVNLAATGSGGTTISWYAASTGGAALGTGNTFTTPSLGATTQYYAAAQITGSTATGIFGTGTTANSTTGYPAPYSNYYGGTKHQMIILASELTTQGLGAGSVISAIRFNVQSVGSAFSGTLNNFQIDMANTATATASSSSFIGGLATVYGPLNQAIPVTGLPQNVTHTLSTNFTWDGTSNIVVQTSYSNANSGTSNTYVTMQNTTTGSLTNYYRLDGGTSAAVLGATTPTGTTTSRPNMALTFTTVCSSSPRKAVAATLASAAAVSVSNAASISICNGVRTKYEITSATTDYDNYNWTVTGGTLYATPTGTIVYTPGSNATEVYFESTTAGTATVTANATNSVNGCVATAVVKNITVLPALITTSASTSNICVSGTSVISITPSTAVSYTNAAIQWQSSPDGSTGWTDIASANGITYTTPTLTATAYYRAFVKNSAGGTCLTSGTAAITVNNPVIISTTPGSRCGTGTVNLSATGSAGATLSWYTASTGGSQVGTGATFTTPSISTNTTYYVGAQYGTGGDFTIGAGASSTTGSGTSGGNGVSPFSHYFGGYKSQYLIRASELTAAGMTAGNINSMSFIVTTAGTTYNAFTINIGHTSLTALTSSFATPTFTTVLNNVSLTPATGTYNIPFASGFNWDGTSNIIVQLCW
ncbi:MAG: hypothetical protein EOP51_11090, partial [Sphingobacteriales bacterium]